MRELEDLYSNTNGRGNDASGGLAGGRTPLGPDPKSQFADFVARHLDMKVRKSAFLSAGILSLLT